MYGKDVAYAFVDRVFTRKLFTLVTWSGQVRSETQKKRFSRFTSTIEFFHDLIHTVDNRFTMAESNKFLMEMIHNSARRYAAVLTSESSGKQRESRRKRRFVWQKDVMCAVSPTESVSKMIDQKPVVKSHEETNNDLVSSVNVAAEETISMFEPSENTGLSGATNYILQPLSTTTIPPAETLHGHIASSASPTDLSLPEHKEKFQDEDDQLETDLDNRSNASLGSLGSDTELYGPVSVST